jgi:small subunit ribosomal protein S21
LTNSLHCITSNSPNLNLLNMLQVLVKDNNIEAALRSLKRKMHREGVFRALKNKKHFETTADKKRRKKKESLQRKRKIQIKFDVVL